ncbi:hypothetical protein [Desmospora profundinema]|uniref:Uncharacterized protein n=1 Tax=Desmospora profundinema TaxID=1571184 RepID=A0ABU1IM06_9BACL|nr:hypothetical protein [Desmospora profundinema]MDR6225806.1 hypothetical protein [Desmospora profundinema]
MTGKLNGIHMARGLFPLLMVVFSANQIGSSLGEEAWLGWGEMVRSGAWDFFCS